MLVSHLIWLVAIWASAQRHLPEMTEVGLMLVPINYDVKRPCERRMFLHAIIEVADDRFDLLESYISGNVAHLNMAVIEMRKESFSTRHCITA